MKSTPFIHGWSVTAKRGIFDVVDGEGPAIEHVTLPHDAMLALPRSADAAAGNHSGYHAGGAVEYTRTLELTPDDSDRVHSLVFDGVYRDAMVFVNDHFAGQNANGYTRFAVNLDPYLRFDAPNIIRVESRAHRDSRWYSGLGIHRNVALVSGPRVHIALDGVRVTTPDVDAAEAMVVVETTVANDGLHTRTVVVSSALEAPDGSVVARVSSPLTLLAGESGAVRERLLVEEPALWSPDTPSLYTAAVAVQDGDTLDEHRATFGVRRLQLDVRHGLRINGRTVKLRGACIHHDNGVIGARSIARAEERRVEGLKQAGFNAIRSAHNPISPELLDACDRLGMLVMDESFDMWAESKTQFDYSTAFPEWWQRDLESMVAQDFNHPSVVFYSIGNEIPETGRPHGARLSRLLSEKLHELDPTRFTTNSINGLVSVMRELPPLSSDQAQDVNGAMANMGDRMTELVASDLVTERTEESLGAADAAGLNYGDGRYLADADRFPHRVIIGTETFPTRIDLAWPMVMENDHIVGDFTWTGWDYLGEAGIGRVDYTEGGGFLGTTGPFPWLLAWCGDIDITGFRRPASYYREIVFGLRTAPFIAVQRPHSENVRPGAGPWSWSDSVASWSWAVDEGTPLRVEVYSDSDEVELMLNGRSLGTAATGRNNRYRTEFTVPHEHGELVAISRSGGVETGRELVRSAAAELELSAVADRTKIRSTDDDLAFVTITLADSAGIARLDSDRPVSVEVAGPGMLLGLGSARPQTEESYLTSTHRTFDGRALAVIRPTGSGTITVTVTSEGFDPQVVTVVAG
ncbi:glycoside hydrolase family 2 TIM barrel-domain containing protein [Salinibacterium sp. G-O1]|uniref:glycoside hydrolase family 2 TIM barrel-domain containing protein n=1 Tax=Salinibacterium sp. G-O1 TaxID=3046208 RepID=UPI0024BB2C9D|nr:glycoside hydrolase family 2 TIM barrel-domain containing protein [Salinibacterium sp. G-O1]MDJ0336259.1 glycoside hydrolase family 2 TIM barrel-domain containing protein [Salinibacterium sp. G-O1]